jgi:hypothetical protein
MRISLLLAVLAGAAPMLTGCQGLERGVLSYPESATQTTQLYQNASPTMYTRQYVTMTPDTNGSRVSLLDRIRGRRTNCLPTAGYVGQTAGNHTIVQSPYVNACSTCNQVGECNCQRTMRVVSTESSSPSPASTFNGKTTAYPPLTDDAVVPPPPSFKHSRFEDAMMKSPQANDHSDASSVVEPVQRNRVPDPAFGTYERTSRPDFAVLPLNSSNDGDERKSQTSDDLSEKRRNEQIDGDYTPVVKPVFPALPSEPGDSSEHVPVNAKPASSSGSDFDPELPHTILPDSLKSLPVVPVPQTPIQDPVNERLALLPDQVADISDQVSEISKRVAELSERVLENHQPGCPAPVDAQPVTMIPAVEQSPPEAFIADEPVVLKARPKENFSLTDNRAAAKDIGSPARNQPQVPIYNVSHHAFNQMGASHSADGDPAYSQIETPRFSSPAVVKRAQTQLPLRYESEAKRAQEQLFDIQSLIQKEIDRRIREGQLVPVKKQPAVNPQSPVGTGTEQTADLNRAPVLQVSQPVSKSVISAAEEVDSPAISLPPRRPATPVMEFEIPANEDVSKDDLMDEECESSTEFRTPNLFVPVLEIGTLQPQLIEINVDADPNDDASFDQVVLTPSRIDVRGIPGGADALDFESDREQTFVPPYQPAGPVRIDSPSVEISKEPDNSSEDVMLRLRATANPAAPEQSSPIVRIRNVSTQFRYQHSQYRDDEVTPLPAEDIQVPAAEEEPGIMEIKTIRALPIHNNEALQQEIRGITERPSKQEPSAARIIER